MRAVTWQGAKDIRLENAPDPVIEDPTDIVIRVGAEVPHLDIGDRVVIRSTSAAATAGCASGTSKASARRRRTSSTAPARDCSGPMSSTAGSRLRMGQANVRRWTGDILDLLDKDEDVLGVESFASHHLSLEEAPDAYATFQKKEDGAVKIVFRP